MPTQILTINDLNEFKTELLNSIKSLIKLQSDSTQKKWLKSLDVKKLLNISHSTLQTLRINGTIPYTKIGGTIYYDIDEINKVMKENSIHHKF